MGMDSGDEWLTYTEAAKRTKNSVRTINRWRLEGLPMQWRGDEGGRVRVVELQALLAWWRKKMAASPVHYYRLRKMALEQGVKPPTPPAMREKPLPDNLTGENPTPDSVPVKLEMPKVRAGAEYDVLRQALKRSEPACRDNDDFTADRLPADVLARLRGVCASCDVLDQCSAFAKAERPAGGFWAGETDAERRSAASA